MTATITAPPAGPPVRPALRRFRPDIEGLRAVAVVTVVLSHAGLGLPGGFVGVDVFFVISGFLITRQLVEELDAHGRVDLARFYARRCRRILPAATLVLLATLLACWVWLSPLRVPPLTLDAALAAVSGVNWRLAATGTDYFAATAPPSPFQHYWSLSVEEQFYLVWPLLLVVSALVLGRAVGRRRAVVGVLAVVIVGSFALSVLLTATAAPLAYFGSHTRAWELALGALVAVTARRWARLPAVAAAASTWLGLGLVAFAVVGYSETVPYPGSLAAVPVLGAVLVIGGGCAAPRGGAETLLAPAPMQLAGRYSYSWYLWHWPLLLLAPAALGRGAEAPPDPVLGFACVAASFGLAAATHRWVEEPFRRSADLVRFPQRAIMIGSGLVAVSVAAAVAVSAAVVVPGSGSGVTVPSVALTPAAVVEATRATTLPANLRPSLEGALRDQADSRNCFDDYFATEPDTSPACVFGDAAGSRTMVLLGDSHAAQWAGPVFAWAEQNGWRVQFMAKSSCQPGTYPDYVVPALQRVYTECNRWRAEAFDFVRATRPEVVVLGSLAKGVTITPDGMAETVSVLRGAGARVLYIADNPYMGIDPPTCLAQYPQDVQRCSVPRGAASVEAPARLAQIEGAQAAGAEVWDPVPYLCAEVCPSVIGDIGVYKDENHITNTFATSLLPQLGPVLTRMAGG